MASRSSDRPANNPTSAAADGSRLAVLGALGALADAVPLPFLPSRLVGQVRGAVAQDVATAHGLTLVTDARALLASPSADEETRALKKALDFLLRRLLRRVGLGPVGPVVRGVEVYALGLLFDRYLGQVRDRDHAARIGVDEARRVRGLIDRSLSRATSPSFQPEGAESPSEAEDFRDSLTRRIDTVLVASASLPAYLRRRLEAAFDEEVARLNEDG